MANRTTNRPSTSTAPLEIICGEFRHVGKNTLIGFCTLNFPAIGLRIRDCAVHVTPDCQMWVGLPRIFRNGKWLPIVEPLDRKAHFRLQAVAVKCIRKYLDSLQTPSPAGQPRLTQTSTEPLGPPKAEIPEDLPI